MTLNRWLAAAALLVAALAALAGDRPVDPPGVRAMELAAWIRARGAVHVFDLRDAAAFAAFHVPTARLPDRPLRALAARAGDTLVLVDAGDHAALRAARDLADAPATVRWLEGGVDAWTRDVLNPTIREDAPDSAFARFGRTAELSRYFGGLPRIVPRGDTVRTSTEETIRRGCGFN